MEDVSEERQADDIRTCVCGVPWLNYFVKGKGIKSWGPCTFDRGKQTEFDKNL